MANTSNLHFSYWVGGGGRQTYFHELVVDHLWCLWFIVIEVHSVKDELSKSSILYMYIEDELKKVNH